MYQGRKVAVVIPALNEAESLPGVLRDVPLFVDRVVVCDNGSSDGTFEVAASFAPPHRMVVVRELRRGYGRACLKALSALKDEELVVFLDADGSDDAGVMGRLLDPLLDGADLCVSNRFTEQLQPGALSIPQVFGNKLAVFLVRLFWGFRYEDLGPFRAVRRTALERLNMCDTTYGWTIEMQVKAVTFGLRIAQVDVPYRARKGGKSKISGTFSGVVLAGAKIVSVILAHRAALGTAARKGCALSLAPPGDR